MHISHYFINVQNSTVIIAGLKYCIPGQDAIGPP
uniref:Uncharacterized protein n=1 Tax=Anguilla anguilla TaxID=7936 RepID=A0A0E9QGC2_ANGAN